MYSIKNCTDTYISLHLKGSTIAIAARGMVNDIAGDKITEDIRQKARIGILAIIYHDPKDRISGKSVTIKQEEVKIKVKPQATEKTKNKYKKENK